MKNNNQAINRLNYTIFGLTFILLTFAPVFAQLDRSFVATNGVDSGTCGAQTSPCRDFNAAIGRTNAGGAVTALDSGIYAAASITITKSITLAAAPGVHADLYNTDNSSRITVNAASTDVVTLRNLFITGKPASTNFYGIGILSVGSLQIENCVIDHFNTGIGTGGMQSSAQLFIKDTISKNNTNSGIQISTGAGLVKVLIDHCQFVNNGNGSAGDGVTVIQRGRVSIRDSAATGNTGSGFSTFGGDLTLDNCESSNNGFGVYASNLDQNTFGTATVSNSLITNNTTYGFGQSGTGVFNSLGNNTVRRNGTGTNGTITVITGT